MCTLMITYVLEGAAIFVFLTFYSLDFVVVTDWILPVGARRV